MSPGRPLSPIPNRRNDRSTDRVKRQRPGQPQRHSQTASRLTLWLPSAAATRKLGRLLSADAQGGDILALSGPLGAGKTCLVTGLARGLGVRGSVTSPSFSLINQHAGRLTLYHVDLYRLGHESELAELGLWEAAEAGGVLAIEWLERFPDAVDADRLLLRLDYSRPPPMASDGPVGQNASAATMGRQAVLSESGPRSRARLAALQARLTE